MLAAIWAQSENGVIGKAQRLPWHLPNDLAFFKKMTENHTIVMGRKTFEGMGSRPLPKRRTIVLTHDKHYQPQNVHVMHTLNDVLADAAMRAEPTFIVGGAAIYQLFLPHCEKLYRTLIHASFAGDTFFPAIDWQEWTLTEKVVGKVDAKNQYAHQFETYIRNT